MTTLKYWMVAIFDRLFHTRGFFDYQEQLAFERRREQIRQSAHFSCRHDRD